MLTAAPAWAQVSGELVVLRWQGGTDAEMWEQAQADFAAKNPGVAVRELVVTGQGDMRGLMRTALLGGEKVDIIINTWPAFRAELADAGILRPIDDLWASAGLDSVLDQSWKDLGSTSGVTYGVNYTRRPLRDLVQEGASRKGRHRAAQDLGRVHRVDRKPEGRRLRRPHRDAREILGAWRMVRDFC